jgi:TRAP-type C4-dicarboxylate transport system permease large subunit
VPMLALFRATLPFYVPLLLTLLILTFVPEISTWIPSLMR